MKKSVGFFECLFGSDYWRHTWVCIALQVFRMMNGINMLNFYSSKIFTMVDIEPRFASFITGMSNFLGTILAMFVVGGYGRKLIFMVSYGFMTFFFFFIFVGLHYNLHIMTIAAISIM